MIQELKAVFFDMGSTLSHQEPMREDLLAGFLRERGHERPVQEIRRALLASDTWWHEWTEQNPFGWRDKSLIQSMRQQYRQRFMQTLQLDDRDGLHEDLEDLWNTSIMRRHTAIFPDVLPTIHALKARRLRLAIVSNWDDSLQSHCDDLGMTPLFDTIVGSSAVGVEKPDPHIFTIALERLGVTADQVLHVGDMYVSDVIGARRAGIVPVLLDRFDLQPDADCLRVRTLNPLLSLL
jgi:putative hydrolase of the HAD superfamily